MSAHNDTASTPANQAEPWTDKAEIAANDTSAGPRADITAADAFGALADAVTAYIKAPQRLKDRRKAVIKVSELLREAFSVRAHALAPLPKQLGVNYEAAADYVYEQLDRWAAQPALTVLFDSISLGHDVRPVVIMSAMRRVPAEEIGVWLSTEFGELSTSREAEHCRRYIATKISAALFDLSAAQPPISYDQPKNYSINSMTGPPQQAASSNHYIFRW